MMKDLEKSYLKLLFDATMNYAGEKELQVGVKYWSPNLNKIVYNYLKTFILGTATGDILVDRLNSALNKTFLCWNQII